MDKKQSQLQVSAQTRQKVETAKLFIERRYAKLIQQERDKKHEWELLYKKMQSLHMSDTEQEIVKMDILHKEAEKLRAARKKISIQDFECLKVIGKGAFGEVRLCRWKESAEPVAIKKMIKSEMVFKNKVIQAREEKDILANAENNHWIVELQCSFQDDKNLYLVMQYLPGGDLMNLLIKKDILSEDEARFYIAETLLALDSVHKLHYIHRDLKPDNILIDKDGHIKLSDFGLCKHTELRPKKLNEPPAKKDESTVSTAASKRKTTLDPKESYKRNRKLAYSAVGTPDYVAPEVQGKSGYTETVDWWSLGVILYEMLVGYPPFVSEESSVTWHKIQNWRKHLVIPKQANLSIVACDLIRKLINDEKDRLGVNGVEQIKAHPFFAGIDWKRIRQSKAPYVPELKGQYDTRYFDPFEEGEPWGSQQRPLGRKRKDIMFIGYTFKKNDSEKSELLKALLDLDSSFVPHEPLHRDNVESLHLEKASKVELTEDQRSKVFKKQKVYRPQRSEVVSPQPMAPRIHLVASTKPVDKVAHTPTEPVKIGYSSIIRPGTAVGNQHRSPVSKQSPIPVIKQREQMGSAKKVMLKVPMKTGSGIKKK